MWKDNLCMLSSFNRENRARKKLDTPAKTKILLSFCVRLNWIYCLTLHHVQSKAWSKKCNKVGSIDVSKPILSIMSSIQTICTVIIAVIVGLIEIHMPWTKYCYISDVLSSCLAGYPRTTLYLEAQTVQTNRQSSLIESLPGRLPKEVTAQP